MATFEEIRDEAMAFARKNGLDEVEAQKHLRRKLKQAGVALPANMATEAEFKQQMRETEEFERNRRNKARTQNNARGGMAKKAQMMKGGMANGKMHMYSAGGAVQDNAGLRALRASGPKGRAAYNKIVNS
tara:strand:- start:267 stop:656 length:390 start_codon:yes stop_codon:yes gene_type:complete